MVRKAPPMRVDSRIYVAGHRGLVGSAIVRALREQGFTNLILRTHAELDLCDRQQTDAFFAGQRPDYVFVAAAKVGGIQANNSYPVDFLRDNLLIETNVIDAAWKNGCGKLLFLGSSCIYPKMSPQPIKEESLLSGPLEPTNEWYAIAKIAGLKLCQAYRAQYGFDAISAMPANLYGLGDNYHPETGHVVPSLLRRFHQAKLEAAPETVIWGSGAPLREFLYADDLADALVFLMQHYSENEHINVGSGEDIAIRDLAVLIAEVVGYKGAVVTDPSKPDGTPRKLVDSGRLFALGWRPKTGLRQGLERVYEDFLRNGNHHE